MPYSYYPTRYPFTLTQHNVCPKGMVESEMHFEGYACYIHDEETQMETWEVEAYCTGFTQYQDGKAVMSVAGLKTISWTVKNLEAFEAACVEAANDQFKLKAA